MSLYFLVNLPSRKRFEKWILNQKMNEKMNDRPKMSEKIVGLRQEMIEAQRSKMVISCMSLIFSPIFPPRTFNTYLLKVRPKLGGTIRIWPVSTRRQKNAAK